MFRPHTNTSDIQILDLSKGKEICKNILEYELKVDIPNEHLQANEYKIQIGYSFIVLYCNKE